MRIGDRFKYGNHTKDPAKDDYVVVRDICWNKNSSLESLIGKVCKVTEVHPHSKTLKIEEFDGVAYWTERFDYVPSEEPVYCIDATPSGVPEGVLRLGDKYTIIVRDGGLVKIKEYQQTWFAGDRFSKTPPENRIAMLESFLRAQSPNYTGLTDRQRKHKADAFQMYC